MGEAARLIVGGVIFIAAVHDAGAASVSNTDASIVLVLESEAGAMMRVDGMTQRECDAARVLLMARGSGREVQYNSFIGNGVVLTPGYVSAPVIARPTLKTASCMLVTDKP